MKNLNPITRTYTQYFVTSKGSHSYFAPEGYEGYPDRFKLYNKGYLPEGEEIYGFEQALEHIKQLKAVIYEGKLQYATEEFQIIIKSVTETFVNV